MAFTTVIMENPMTGAVKKAPVGFSWTTLFFGLFPAVFRGDWKWAAIQFVAALFTFGLSSLIFIFIYNKLHIRDLVRAGFQVKSVETGSIDLVSTSVGLSVDVLQPT